MATVALFFGVTIMLSNKLLDSLKAPYTLTMFAMMLVAGGCWVMGTE